MADWKLHTSDLQKFHCNILRQCLGVGKGTASLCVFAECGKYPLQIHWLIRAAKYWNKLVTMQAGSNLLTEVLSANVHFGLTEGHKCWSKEFCEGLKFVDAEFDWLTHLRNLQQQQQCYIIP